MRVTRFLAHWRASGAGEFGMTPLEYGLVAAFILMSLVAAVPGLAATLAAAAQGILDQFA